MYITASPLVVVSFPAKPERKNSNGRKRRICELASNLRVQLFCDYSLRYQIAMDALDAVSGYVEEGGRVVRSTDDIQLASPEQANAIAN